MPIRISTCRSCLESLSKNHKENEWCKEKNQEFSWSLQLEERTGSHVLCREELPLLLWGRRKSEESLRLQRGQEIHDTVPKQISTLSLRTSISFSLSPSFWSWFSFFSSFHEFVFSLLQHLYHPILFLLKALSRPLSHFSFPVNVIGIQSPLCALNSSLGSYLPSIGTRSLMSISNKPWDKPVLPRWQLGINLWEGNRIAGNMSCSYFIWERGIKKKPFSLITKTELMNLWIWTDLLICGDVKASEQPSFFRMLIISLCESVKGLT